MHGIVPYMLTIGSIQVFISLYQRAPSRYISPSHSLEYRLRKPVLWKRFDRRCWNFWTLGTRRSRGPWVSLRLGFQYSNEARRPLSICEKIGKIILTVDRLPVWPDWAIYWTLGKILKPLATINLPKSLTFLGIFCKCVKIYHFSSVIIFGQLLWRFFSGHTASGAKAIFSLSRL